MMNFCTLFNSYYLHKGLATYLSLERVAEDFQLYVMAFDKECYDKLRSFGLKHITVELLDNFETQELLAVKPTRNMAEYCWTCGPSVIYHFLTKYNLPSLTYIDADMYFINDPHVLFDELGDASIGLSEHWFYKPTDRAGRFCVQYNYFKNDERGLLALKYWRDSCIDWCYARYEDGKFGDQFYVENIYNNFKGVHVFEHRGCGVATWNQQSYSYPDAEHLIYNGKVYPIIFYHFHGMKFKIESQMLTMTSGEAAISKLTRDKIYEPYLQLVKEVYNRYLGYNIIETRIKDISVFKKAFDAVKHSLSDNVIARFIYYKVFNVRYNGYEKK